MKNKNISKFVTSLVYIALGAALIAEPRLVEDMFSYMLAGAALIIGVLKLIGYLVTKVETRIAEDTNGFALGLSLMILGAFILMESAMFIMLIPFVLGFMITFKGIEGLQNLLNLRKFGYGMNKVLLIVSLVITGFGILVMINPFSTKKVLLAMLGIGLLVSGVFDIIADAVFTHKLKKGIKPEESAIAEAVESVQDKAEDIVEDIKEKMSDDVPTLEL
ncbi:MAG: DUF308 domain-containing protein [Firmicutes bacterium]|nr:DUF308 domain-containing protein [Bacillota bacterium]MBR5488994.1 DUF308 domain-containing protein [Bacillota bacterium]